MKRRTLIFCMSAAIVVSIIGIAACDNASPLADETSDSVSPGYITGSSPSTIDSTDITLSAGVTNGTASLEALDQQQGVLTFDAYSSDTKNITNAVTVSTPLVSPSSDPGMMYIPYHVYESTPQTIVYNGNGQLNYYINGSMETYSLDGWDQELVDWMETMRTTANDEPGPPPIYSSLSGSTHLNPMKMMNSI